MQARYLRPAKQMPEIYLYRAPVDFRKQANGLALLVEQELGCNPFSGALYAFTSRQRNKIKCVMRLTCSETYSGVIRKITDAKREKTRKNQAKKGDPQLN